MEGIYHNCTDIWKNKKGYKKFILIEWGYKVMSKIDEKMKIPTKDLANTPKMWSSKRNCCVL